ncbi:D-methionine transport system substrate-binding protein [Pseudoclavibacter sp. JAI123]|uniref:MetQ/NlpA family ABC transporter substrate-binding protein n=1 Tax=unclassified Pseudoclavibacter TaxID=2615177 RepID=UPI0015C802B0|nr:MetQ/NlpA family ABC transporter substrate-binding protein [Pseudoclavibacter sp. JAI123]NYF11884.1 D-methionine transport system substrate-binding protein [Pseudoclavibacter sp. JAI123]
MSRFTKIAAAVGAIALVGGLSACSTGASDENTIRLGVVGASDPYWDVLVEEAAAEDLTVELVDFSDYNQPNPATSEGELDVNAFQHIIYLAQHNAASGDDLVPIGSTAIYPLGFYSSQYDSVDAIPDGAEVAVPNDASNRARGLLVLQEAGLIELKDGGSPFSTLDDVLPESRVTVTELEASVTATSLPDLAGAIINNDFVENAGLTTEDALTRDDPQNESAFPYINIFVTTAENADNENYLKLVEIYQNSEGVAAAVKETFGETAVLTKTPVDELQTTLDELVAEIEAQG